MKYISLILISIILFSCGTTENNNVDEPTEQQELTAEEKTALGETFFIDQKSTKYNVSYKLPAGWDVTENDEKTHILIINSAEPNDAPIQSNIGIMVYQNLELDEDAFMNSIMDVMREFENLKPIDRNHDNMEDGTHYYYFKYGYTLGDKEATAITMVYIKGTTGIAISGTSLPDKFDEMYPVFEEVLLSVNNN